jgi:putative hydrolase of the HAD superfamily
LLNPSPRAVLLDAGNTLICLDFAEIGRLITEAGIEISAAQLERAEYHGREAINALVTGTRATTDQSRAYVYFSAILSGAGVAAGSIRALFDVIRAKNEEVGLWRIVPPGVHDALQALKQRGVALGVISNADGRVEAQLAAAQLSHLLDFVIDSHRVGVEKPDPRIFEEAVYVGDMYTIDVVGARAIGMGGVLVDPLMLESVDCPRVRSVAELPELLDQHRAHAK